MSAPDSSGGASPVVRISPEELARAAPPPPLPPGPPPRPPRLSHLAVASLALAILSVPLFGIFLGPLAVACGIIALGVVEARDRLTGARLAVAGIVVGTLSIIGWGIGLTVWFSRREPEPPRPPALAEAAARSPAGIADAPEHIRRALRANIALRCEGRDGAVHEGSGVVVARDTAGWVAVTNLHVAACGDRGTLTARVTGGVARPAERCWTAPEGVDAALVRVTGAGAPEPIRLGAPGPARIGDPVFAVGNPLGYETTFTAGVLSAVREGGQGDGLRVLQVQASVNPGHSGGGLYAADGRLIGINTWIAADAVAGGIGFALSAEDLARLVSRASAPCARAVSAAPPGGAPP